MNLNEIKLTPLIDTLRLEKIDDAIYFSEKYSGYVSNSRLGLLNPRQEGSPEKFFAGFKPIGYAPALELGSAVHELVLQSHLFELAEDLGKPTAKLGAVADVLYPIFLEHDITIEDVINASDKIDYYKGKITNDRFNEVITKCTPYWKARQQQEYDLNITKERIFMDTKSRETVKSCVEALTNNKSVQDLLHPTGLLEEPISENEQAILLDVEAECPNGKKFIIRLKAKIDNYTIDKESNTIIVNDVKTIGKIVSEIENNIKKFRYSREIAMYVYLLKLCAEKYYNLSNPKIQANYLVVSTIPNFYSKVRPVMYSEIREGFNEFKKLLKYVAYLIGYQDFTLNEQSSKYQF
jgi:hypothetical protein